MTQNKFWLVWQPNIIYNRHETQELAIKEAKGLAIVNQDSTYYVLEATHSFKADVNIVETSFEATPEQSSEVEPKFKIGDIVNINAIGFKGSQFEITYCNGNKENYYYSVKNIENQDEQSHGINECDIILAEPTVMEMLNFKFKVGDIVNHKYYGKCKIQQLKYVDSNGNGAWYDVTDDSSPVWFMIKEEKLTHAEPTPEPVEAKFKFGDRVLLDNYFECIVDDYDDETKSYKLSIIGGGYSIVNESRVTKK